MFAKPCIVCGGEFTGAAGHFICGPACRLKRRRQPAPKIVKRCVECDGEFSGALQQLICGPVCRNIRIRRIESARIASHQAPRQCKRCGTAMEYGDRNRFCSDACRLNLTARPVVTSDNAKPCEHCGTLFEPMGRRSGRPRRFCQPACRVAHHKAEHVEDDGGEIPVADLEQCGRRAAVARLFDKYDYDDGGRFYHGPLAPTWINPADRRAGR